MSISPVDFCAVGDRLLAATSEADQRSAASRYYYAAFHRAAAWHAALPAPGHDLGPRGGKHQVLINMLRNPAPAALDAATRAKSVKLAMKLDVLRTRRVTADYKLADSFPSPDATMQRDQAKSLINHCDSP